MISKCHLKITGKVQGVAFRYYTKLKAEELGLMGTTENKSDGSVETIVVGHEAKINAFVQWCQTGSPASRVEEVIMLSLGEGRIEDYTRFTILR